MNQCYAFVTRSVTLTATLESPGSLLGNTETHTHSPTELEPTFNLRRADPHCSSKPAQLRPERLLEGTSPFSILRRAPLTCVSAGHLLQTSFLVVVFCWHIYLPDCKLWWAGTLSCPLCVFTALVHCCPCRGSSGHVASEIGDCFLLPSTFSKGWHRPYSHPRLSRTFLFQLRSNF